jgi:hypothetical protein
VLVDCGLLDQLSGGGAPWPREQTWEDREGRAEDAATQSTMSGYQEWAITSSILADPPRR